MKENEGEQNTSGEGVQQTVIRLPYLDEEVPALRVSDGKLYIPVVALCHMLGIEPERHIRRWHQMLLWEGSLKLPYRSPKGYQRTVWCLPLPMVPFACGYFNWNLVSPARRGQLHQLVEEASGVLYREQMPSLVCNYRHDHCLAQLVFRIPNDSRFLKERRGEHTIAHQTKIERGSRHERRQTSATALGMACR